MSGGNPIFSGYSDSDLQILQQNLARQNAAQAVHSAPTMFRAENNDNLIKYQLDIKEELERIEHLLRKHVPKVKDNKIIYEEPEEADKIFNETGVNEILNILAWYLNKNILLSNFTEKEIMKRCEQFSMFLKRFIFNNHERFGLDTEDKQKHYPMIHMNIVNTVEAAYNRALGGGERESLRTARQVTQQEPLYGGGMMPMGGMPMGQPKRSIFKPWTWGK